MTCRGHLGCIQPSIFGVCLLWCGLVNLALSRFSNQPNGKRKQWSVLVFSRVSANIEIIKFYFPELEKTPDAQHLLCPHLPLGCSSPHAQMAVITPADRHWQQNSQLLFTCFISSTLWITFGWGGKARASTLGSAIDTAWRPRVTQSRGNLRLHVANQEWCPEDTFCFRKFLKNKLFYLKKKKKRKRFYHYLHPFPFHSLRTCFCIFLYCLSLSSFTYHSSSLQKGLEMA